MNGSEEEVGPCISVLDVKVRAARVAAKFACQIVAFDPARNLYTVLEDWERPPPLVSVVVKDQGLDRAGWNEVMKVHWNDEEGLKRACTRQLEEGYTAGLMASVIKGSSLSVKAWIDAGAPINQGVRVTRRGDRYRVPFVGDVSDVGEKLSPLEVLTATDRHRHAQV